MKRRELLIGAGAAVAAMTAGKAMAAGMDHSAHMGHGGNYSALIAAATECHKTAMACQAHCLETFAAGDTTLALCAKEVTQMMAVCEATVKTASLNAVYFKELVAVCKKAGESCQAECLKHAKKHDICRVAAEDCGKCIKECDKILA